MAGANESPSSSKKAEAGRELRATVSEISATRQLTEEEVLEKRSILKNVLVVSFAFTLQFTSYNSMENMQSSLNNDDGTTSLAALYAGFLFSGCFLPSLLLKHLKEKYTLALSAFSFSVYMAAQFYPKIYLLVPTAVVLGLGAASLWASKGTYITKSGKRYAEITGEDTCAVITKFFSIFYMFYQSTQVWGNLLSSAVLSIDAEVEFNKSEDDLHLCGYNFCVSRRDSYNESFTVGNGTQEVPARIRQTRPLANIRFGNGLRGWSSFGFPSHPDFPGPN
ncbi:UNC93-like protein [Macrobrachium nipponense]|uniref:UNC93-like protein n=1 Tax=Macrobrachium nipponense TaxID=159736 RepID=UPI0030C8C8D9